MAIDLTKQPSSFLAQLLEPLEECLTPELAQKIRQAYQRLALQHGWPPLAEEVELPGGLKSRVAWFFKADPRFKHALHAKWRDMARSAATSTLAKQRETCSRCKHEQFIARDPFRLPFQREGDHICLGRLRSTQGADGHRGGEYRNVRACRMGGRSRQCCRLRLAKAAWRGSEGTARQPRAPEGSGG